MGARKHIFPDVPTMPERSDHTIAMGLFDSVVPSQDVACQGHRFRILANL